MAGTIRINPQRVRDVSRQFQQTSQQSQEMVTRMRSTVTNLGQEWDGMSEQHFMGDYQKWEKQMTQYVTMLQDISKHLDRIAREFEQLDQTVARTGGGGR